MRRRDGDALPAPDRERSAACVDPRASAVDGDVAMDNRASAGSNANDPGGGSPQRLGRPLHCHHSVHRRPSTPPTALAPPRIFWGQSGAEPNPQHEARVSGPLDVPRSQQIHASSQQTSTRVAADPPQPHRRDRARGGSVRGARSMRCSRWPRSQQLELPRSQQMHLPGSQIHLQVPSRCTRGLAADALLGLAFAPPSPTEKIRGGGRAVGGVDGRRLTDGSGWSGRPSRCGEPPPARSRSRRCSRGYPWRRHHPQPTPWS